ncbi:4-vinyl reductase [Candidatus Micrarchaeota archaeon]|nr:4-vinyl reductase [Candidatus Micrarchaeota archaeon]
MRYTHHNFLLMNVPFSIVPVDVLVGLAQIEDVEVNQRLYDAVKKHVSGSLVQSFQLGPPLEKAVLFLEEFFTASGWGLVRRVDLDAHKSRAIIVVEDNPVARSLQGKAKKPVDHLVRGVLAGVFSHLFKDDVDCVEHSCMALGAGRCEFIIKPQFEFDFSKPESRDQLLLEEAMKL